MKAERGEPNQGIVSKPEIRIEVDPDKLKIDPYNLFVGVIFEGLENIEMLDDFYINLATYGHLFPDAPRNLKLMYPFYRKEFRQQLKRPRHSGTRPFPYELPSFTLEYMAEKNKFFGSLKNFTLEILSPQSDKPIPRLSSSMNPDLVTEGLGVLTTGEMHSSGRGKIGMLSTHTRSFYTYYENSGLDSSPKSIFVTKEVRKTQGRKAIEKIKEEASERAEETKRENMRKASSAGLGSMGKRS